MKRLTAWILTVMAGMILLMAPAHAEGERVYVIHLDKFDQIDQGVALIVRRGIQDAENDPKAIGILYNIDTPGGLVTAALDIKDAIFSSTLPTVAYVDKQAWSAGALVAISAEKLYMHSAGSIGAAEPRFSSDPDQPADPKVVSALRKAFEAAAEARGRDPRLAAAMVDRDYRAPGQDQALLTLTAKAAVDAMFADGLAATREEAAELGLGRTGITFVDVTPSPRERFAQWLINPTVASLLLVVGIVGIGIEIMKPGVALPGFIGLVSLGLFFAGNMLVGTAGWLEIALLLLGVLLLVIEVFVPGFGVFGIGGTAAIGFSIFLAVPDTTLAMRYLLWMAVAFVAMLLILLPTFARKGLGKLLTLEQSLGGSESSDRNESLRDLIGQEGQAITTLRPAGMAAFGDRRVDVVTEGGYLDPGTAIVVLRIDGTRVVVRAK